MMAAGTPRSFPITSSAAAASSSAMATSVTCNRRAARRLDGVSDPLRRPVWVSGQQGGLPVGHVGEIDAGVGADEAVRGLGDNEVAAPAKHTNRLALHEALPCLAVAVIYRSQSSLGFRDDLLGDHHDVARPQLGGVGDEGA